MATTLKTRKDIYDNLMQKAAEDADFRAALLSDPKDTIQKEYEIKIPENMEIKIHESDLNTVHLALPISPQALQEGQLAGIGGGANSPAPGYDCQYCT